MNAPIRILVADDSQTMRRAISMLLAAEPRITVCGEASTYSELLKKIEQLDPRVVLMDLHMSDERNFDCTYIKDQLRRSRLLAMSVWTDEVTASLAHSYGAVRLLDKCNLASSLMPTIEECTGEKVWSRHA